MLLVDPAIGEIQGVKGEAVVNYREPLTTKEMRYPRLSRRVENMTNKIDCPEINLLCFSETVSNDAKTLVIIAIINPLSCLLCNDRVNLDRKSVV